MPKNITKNSLIIACDGEAASGKSTGAKLISKKYKLLLINSGLFYRYASKIILKDKPNNIIPYLEKKFKRISYSKITKLNLHTQEISNHVGFLAKKKKVRILINKKQKNIIKKNNRICVEGRDIASNILKKNPKYHIAFYFTCNIKVASYRRWLDLKKKIPFKDVKYSLLRRTKLDKNRYYSPLKKFDDAILIKTHKLNKTQMLNKMIKEIEQIKKYQKT